MARLIAGGLLSWAAAQPLGVWPQFGFDPSHNGVSGLAGPSVGVLKWESLTGGQLTGGPVIGPTGIVYVGSAGTSLYHNGSLIAFDGKTGTQLWNFTTSPAGYVSSPVIGASASGGTVYFGASGFSNFPGDPVRPSYVYAVDASTGAFVWRHQMTAFINAGLTLGGDGTLYLHNVGTVYAFHPSGAIAWTATAGSSSTPAIGFINIKAQTTSLVTVSTVSDPFGSNVSFVTFDPTTGAVRLQLSFPNAHCSDPTVTLGDNIVYFGLSNSSGDFLVGLALGTGAQTFSFRAGGFVDAPSTNGDGSILYFDCLDYLFYAVGKSGAALLWTYELDAFTGSSGSIGTNGLLYVGGRDSLLAFNALTGHVVWSYVNPAGYGLGTPALGLNGTLFAGGNGGGAVFAFADNAVLMLTAFPPLGGLSPISGVVTGLANPTAFWAVLYVRDAYNVNWWIKAFPDSHAPLNGQGAFTFTGWASSPATDPSDSRFAIFIVPSGTPLVNTLGGPLPTYMGVSVASGQYPPGFVPTSQASITITAFPALGALTPIAGILSGAPSSPSNYKAVLYVRDAFKINWWVKPFPDSFSPLDAAGDFSFATWASSPATDTQDSMFALFILPVGTPIINTLGGPLPTYPSALVATTYSPGYTPPGGGGGGGGGGGVAIKLTATPPPGGLTAIAGSISGLVAAPQTYEVLLYLEEPVGVWWIKALPGSAYPITPSGTFSITTWASNPTTDVGWLSFTMYVVPVGTAVPTVLGGPLPAYLVTNGISVGTAHFAAGFVAAADANDASSQPSDGSSSTSAIAGGTAAGACVLVVAAVLSTWLVRSKRAGRGLTPSQAPSQQALGDATAAAAVAVPVSLLSTVSVVSAQA